jgi:hypothetical protein
VLQGVELLLLFGVFALVRLVEDFFVGYAGGLVFLRDDFVPRDLLLLGAVQVVFEQRLGLALLREVRVDWSAGSTQLQHLQLASEAVLAEERVFPVALEGLVCLFPEVYVSRVEVGVVEALEEVDGGAVFLLGVDCGEVLVSGRLPSRGGRPACRRIRGTAV